MNLVCRRLVPLLPTLLVYIIVNAHAESVQIVDEKVLSHKVGTAAGWIWRWTRKPFAAIDDDNRKSAVKIVRFENEWVLLSAALGLTITARVQSGGGIGRIVEIQESDRHGSNSEALESYLALRRPYRDRSDCVPVKVRLAEKPEGASDGRQELPLGRPCAPGPSLKVLFEADRMVVLTSINLDGPEDPQSSNRLIAAIRDWTTLNFPEQSGKLEIPTYSDDDPLIHVYLYSMDRKARGVLQVVRDADGIQIPWKLLERQAALDYYLPRIRLRRLAVVDWGMSKPR